jgi:3'-phosphoadenosine 5'-phosphosulfate sulfotransferase (PAPS reductase)/FAD synthetase
MKWLMTEKDQILEYYNYCNKQRDTLLRVFLNTLNYRDFKILVLDKKEFEIFFNDCLENFKLIKENIDNFDKDININILNETISIKIVEDYAKLLEQSFDYLKYIAKLIEDKLEIEDDVV